MSVRVILSRLGETVEHCEELVSDGNFERIGLKNSVNVRMGQHVLEARTELLKTAIVSEDTLERESDPTRQEHRTFQQQQYDDLVRKRVLAQSKSKK